MIKDNSSSGSPNSLESEGLAAVDISNRRGLSILSVMTVESEHMSQ
jgi:hypothetical protein